MAGIALLHLAEQAFFGGEQGALAVDVDGAAFEDDAGLPCIGANLLAPAASAIRRADFFVVLLVGIFCPGVEAPFDGGAVEANARSLDFARDDERRVGYERAAGVAGPDAICRPAVEAHVVA